MAQNTQSATATRNTVPGTANDAPVVPELFTGPARREYVPDAKRVGDAAQAPELAKARELFANGDYALARAEARRVVKDAQSTPAARMEAGDLLDRTEIDHGPIAAAVAFVILFALMLMYLAMNGK
ncbi:MAG TPA: hypothetical protein VLW85_24955 [Myxococcales bacterium]|nr:hypothetical protein [Myxococcales bacterium]